MSASQWHLSFGANPHCRRTEHNFEFGRRAQQTLSVAIEGRPHWRWRGDDAGWFEVEADCGAGTRYQYVLARWHAVPDPAARAQSGDIHGPSIVIDPCSYRWRNRNWRGRPWQEAVIYELHVGLLGGFTASRGNCPACRILESPQSS